MKFSISTALLTIFILWMIFGAFWVQPAATAAANGYAATTS